jgi:hypothetical protein
MRTPATVFTSASPLGASIALVTLLFMMAVIFFLWRDVAPLDLLKSTFSPNSQADYAFTLEQRVAPQRAASSRPAD